MSSRNPPRITITLRSFLMLLLILVLIILLLVIPGKDTPETLASSYDSPTPSLPVPTSTSPGSPTPEPSSTTGVLPIFETPEPPVSSRSRVNDPLAAGWIILSMNDGGYAHLFAYQPAFLPLTRLTNNPWDDMDPVISPDGSRVAFRSRQNGYWDLYVLELETGQQTRLTDTPEYDGSPSWSPDGNWLVYETYLENNLELAIRSMDDPGADPIRLTQDPASDTSPSWSPTGRKIAFISNRSGSPDVWLADLDQVEDRFHRLSTPGMVKEAHPAWNPDGNSLVWSAVEPGGRSLYRLDLSEDNSQSVQLRGGDLSVWDPGGTVLLTSQTDPNHNYLSAYDLAGDTLLMPALPLPGALHGLDWAANPLPESLGVVFEKPARVTATPLWESLVTPVTEGPAGRSNVVPLASVSASYAYLLDEVDEAFIALRTRIGQETGWDLLSSLENAYVPLANSLAPGMQEDWLYTGRAFAFPSAPVSAGWMVINREEFGGQTYWRVFLKARYQDGSQGTPLTELPWDMNARSNGDPQVYEAGGKWAEAVPAGYWIDLTDLAGRYGWNREAALVNWRTFYQGTRFNELVMTGGLDWKSAMLQIYPPEILSTPTQPAPVSKTPTPYPAWYKTRVPTQTSSPTITPSLRPTWTPAAPSP